MVINMKIRHGFVSNSSSGSFIFPKHFSIKDVENIIDDIENFMSSLGEKDMSAGLCKPEKYEMSGHTGRYIDEYYEIKKKEDFKGCVIAHTCGDNTCPYAIHIILEQIIGCTYIHYG